MAGIFINKVAIKNYKCFVDQGFHLSAPDGSTPGSGLNVLIGENGNGKTAFLEAINYTNQSSYASGNRLQVHDFNDYRKPIKVTVSTNDFVCKMAAPYMGCTFDCDGITFQAKNRDRKSAGKLLSSPFSISTSFKTKRSTYNKKNGNDSGKVIPSLHKIFSNSNIENNELNVFYFDKNRSRQLSVGTYKTTFERICEDLNWKFIKNIQAADVKELLDNVSGEYFSNVMSIAQKGTGSKLADEMKDYFGQDQYANLQIDLLDLLHPFRNAFFSIRDKDTLTQISPRNLGSGIEIILTLLLLRSIASVSKGGIVYLLDEPELHLHPKAQEKLVDLMMDESKDKQIIVSTHSPYLIKGCMQPTVNKLILRRNDQDEIEVDDVNSANWGLFPWSPSWGEVNYVAYDLTTVDYHNELYGWIQEKHKLWNETAVEQYLENKGIEKNKQWVRIRNGQPQSPYDITLCSYIRNSIHHPENTSNIPYTETELSDSIALMKTAIKP